MECTEAHLPFQFNNVSYTYYIVPQFNLPFFNLPKETI